MGIQKVLLDNKGSIGYKFDSDVTARFEAVGQNKVNCWLYQQGCDGVQLSKEGVEQLILILQKQVKRM